MMPCFIIVPKEAWEKQLSEYRGLAWVRASELSVRVRLASLA